MEQPIVLLIVGIIYAVVAVVKKLKGATDDYQKRNPPPDRNLTNTPPQLTEADRRYREVQEDIRRRIASRQAQQQASDTRRDAPAPPIPRYKPSPYATTPVGGNRDPAIFQPKPPVQPAKPVTAPKPAPVAASPARPEHASSPQAAPAETMASALTDNSQTAAASEVAAYAGGTPANITMGADLRALLSTPNAFRQAFLLREVLERPLALRTGSCGGLETWG